MIQAQDVKRKVQYTFIILAGLYLMVLADYIGIFEGINSYFYDASFRIRGEREPSENIVIAAIDEKTLKQYGRWPVNRSLYAGLLEKLSMAKIVGFDLLINEGSGDDVPLKEAIGSHGRVVLPLYIDTTMNIISPLEFLSPHGTGHVHIEQGVDSVVREVFHTIYYRDKKIPSFPSVLYEVMTNKVMPREDLSPGEGNQLAQSGIVQGDGMKINYYGSPGTFRKVSMADILDERVPPSFFRDKAVLVGVSASGVVDSFLTPYSQKRNRMAGVEVFASALNNLLDNSSVKEVGDTLRYIFSIVMFVPLPLLLMKVNEKKAVFISLTVMTVIALTVFLLFSSFHVWISPSLYFALTILACGTTYFFKLNETAVHLEMEYSAVASLLGIDASPSEQTVSKSGFVSFLSRGGINEKIGRLIHVEQQYERSLEATVKKRTEELSGAMSVIESMSNEMVMRLISAAESKDRYTGEHIARFGLYASRLSEALGMPPSFVEDISFASLMHDIGKIGIPDSILLKSGRLTEDEFAVIKEHTTIGEKILSGSSYPKIRMASGIAQSHHERWDGSGYPKGLKGTEIPLESRIVMVCDQYEALRSERPYKSFLDHETAFRIITEGDERTRPEHFDPDVINAFVRVAPAFDSIYRAHHD